MASEVWADSSAIGVNDGTSAEDAFTNLQTAINDLDAAGSILHAKGVFNQDISISFSDMVLSLFGDLSIVGTGAVDAFSTLSDVAIVNETLSLKSFSISEAGTREVWQVNGGVVSSARDVLVLTSIGNRCLFAPGSNPTTVNLKNVRLGESVDQTVFISGSSQVNITLGENGVDHSARIDDGTKVLSTNTNVLSSLDIFGGIISGQGQEALRTTSNMPVRAHNSVVFGAPLDPKTTSFFMVQGGAVAVELINSRTYYPPTGATANMRFSGLVTETNPIQGPVPWVNPRRGGFITLSTDDLENIGIFLQRNIICEQFGFKQTLLLDRLTEVTAQNWADLNAAQANGHLITNHSVHESQLGSLTSINFTGDPITVNVGSDNISGTGFSLALSAHSDIAALATAINSQSGYTASVDASVDSANNGNHVPESLADVAGGTSPLLYDATRVFANEVLAGRTILESNLTGHTDNTYGFVGGARNDVYESLFDTNGYLSSRTTVANSSVDGFSKVHYPAFQTLAFRLSDFVPTSAQSPPPPYTLTDDEVRQKIYGLCAWADHYGCVVDLYAHPDTEYPIDKYAIVVEAIADARISQGTQRDAANFIRNGAVESIESGVFYYLTDYDVTDNQWQPLVADQGRGVRAGIRQSNGIRR